ncbi:fluoride efflux transporter CrcB [Prevotella sp.]|uniref:fluoride efflux transporter CrcB n=1 Tax=Prevotella sp. TaxID=59823 RepID=UPI002F93DDAC
MLKDFLLVGAGSFLGGGARFLLSKWLQTSALGAFPLATFAVNILGCLLIGLLLGLSGQTGWLSPSTKLLLTTGFCGGFTTFSTFMNENYLLLKDHHFVPFFLYLFASLALGLFAVIAGYQLATWLKTGG